MRSIILALVVAIAAGACTPGDAAAQLRRGRTAPPRGGAGGSPDLSVLYGHMWGGNVSSRPGTLRLGTAPSWGLAADIPVGPATWVEVGYGHQDGQLDLDRGGGKTKLSDLSVNYWQIGGVRGVPRGPVIPYVAASLGINHLSPAEDTVEIDGETGRLESTTRFALSLGVGFKTFLGQQRRFGIRGSFRALTTLYDTSTGFWFGSGGGGVSFGGSGVWQWEVAGGVTVRLG